MEEKKKVFIRGRKGRGSEVIDILTKLGATNVSRFSCENEDTIYFIDPNNKINWAFIDSLVGTIIMDNYKEVGFLPQRSWEDGDILAFDQIRSALCLNQRSSAYAVFKKYTGNKTFDSYIFIHGEEMHFGITFPTAEFHLANEEEKEDFSKMYNYMVSHLKAANAVLNKDAE